MVEFCLEVGTNFSHRLRTSSSDWENWASKRLTTVLRVFCLVVFCLVEVVLRDP